MNTDSRDVTVDAGWPDVRARLVAGREALGLSDSDIATFLGPPITVEYVRGIERGSFDPSAAVVARYLRAVGEELIWVMDGEVQTRVLREPVAGSDDFVDEFMLANMGGDPESALGKGFADDVRDAVILRELVSRLGNAFREPLAVELLSRASGIPRGDLERVITHRTPATVELVLRAYGAAGAELRVSTPSAELSRSGLVGESPVAAATSSAPASRVRPSQHPGGRAYWR